MAQSNVIYLLSGDALPLFLQTANLATIAAQSHVKEDSIVSANTDIPALMRSIKRNTVGSRFRVFVLHPDDTIAYEIPQEDIIEGGSYNENYQDGQRRSMSITLVNEDGKYSPNINTLWATTRLRLDMGVEDISGNVLWVEKGIFFLNNANMTYNDSSKTVALTANDKFSIFESKVGTLTDTYEIPIGTDIEEVIKSILMMDDGSGYPLDSSPIMYHSSFQGKKTQATISKSAGETYGSILLELATQLSAEIFYNSQGNLTFVPTNETSLDEDKPLLDIYDSASGDIAGLDFSFDMSSIVNKIIVLGSSNSGAVARAEAVNDDPGSPLCYQRIGYRVGSIINDSDIYNDVLAKDRADYELRKQLILKSSTNVTVSFNPLMTVNNLVAISDEFYKMSKERFLISSYSCPLDYNGTMSISISNVKNIPTLM